MIPAGYKPQSDFAKKWLAAGREEGREEGRLEAKAESLLLLLRARGLSVSSEASERIGNCKDIALLDAWIQRAATASMLDEVFDL